MKIDLSTPALLFPAISLLFLAYTNRYLALASVIRHLSANVSEHNSDNVLGQVQNLYRRIRLIRYMQMAGILSLMACLVSMSLIWLSYVKFGEWAFALSLQFMMLSLALSLIEVSKSGVALSLELDKMKTRLQKKPL
jgi:hypothetical protein